MPLALWPLLLGALAAVRPALFVPTTWPRRIWLVFALVTSVPAVLLTGFAYFWLWAGDGVLNLIGVPLLTMLYGFWSRRFARGWAGRRGHAGILGTVVNRGALTVAAYVAILLTLISIAALHFVVFGQAMDIE